MMTPATKLRPWLLEVRGQNSTLASKPMRCIRQRNAELHSQRNIFPKKTLSTWVTTRKSNRLGSHPKRIRAELFSVAISEVMYEREAADGALVANGFAGVLVCFISDEKTQGIARSIRQIDVPTDWHRSNTLMTGDLASEIGP